MVGAVISGGGLERLAELARAELGSPVAIVVPRVGEAIAGGSYDLDAPARLRSRPARPADHRGARDGAGRGPGHERRRAGGRRAAARRPGRRGAPARARRAERGGDRDPHGARGGRRPRGDRAGHAQLADRPDPRQPRAVGRGSAASRLPGRERPEPWRRGALRGDHERSLALRDDADRRPRAAGARGAARRARLRADPAEGRRRPGARRARRHARDREGDRALLGGRVLLVLLAAALLPPGHPGGRAGARRAAPGGGRRPARRSTPTPTACSCARSPRTPTR